MNEATEELNLSPFEAHVRVVSPLSFPDVDEDSANSEAASEASQLPHVMGDDLGVLDESLLVTTVPDPIRLRGIGGSTM